MAGARLGDGALTPAPSPEEAAAIVAALEHFMRATATSVPMAAAPLDGWRRTAAREAVEREPEELAPTSWINT